MTAQIAPLDRNEPAESQKRFAPRYIHDVVAGDEPSVALGQSLREILRAAEENPPFGLGKAASSIATATGMSKPLPLGNNHDLT
jgi:hypothetical protein